MTLRGKLILATLPLFLVAIFGLGIWHYQSAAVSVEHASRLYLDTTLNAYFDSELQRRHLLLERMGVSQVRSFNQQYQDEALEAARRIAEKQRGNFLIIDNNNRLILTTGDISAGSFYQWYRSSGSARQLELEFGEIDASLTKESGGFIFVQRHFSPWNWNVIYLIDRSTHLDSLNNILVSTLLVAGVMGVVTLLLLYLFVRNILLRNIALLSRSAEEIARGGELVTIPVRSDDELGELAANMEVMSRAINDSQKVLEQRVKERTEQLGRFKSTLDKTMDCVFMFEPQGLRFFYVNQGAIQSVGYTYDELMGMTPMDITPDFAQSRFREMSESLIRGPAQSLTFEAQHRHKDGHDIPVEVFLQYIDPSDAPPRFLAIVRDISERRQAEVDKEIMHNYIKEVLDSMPSIIAGIDQSGNVTHWNRKAIEMSGIEAEEAIGVPVAKTLPMFDSKIDEILAAATAGKELLLSRISYRHNSDTHYADILLYPLGVAGMEGAVLRIDDITERARMEEMMVQTEKMLSVGGLAGGMAHELNNPIGGMVQGIQNIRRRLSTEVAKNVDAAAQAGMQINQLQQYLELREVGNLLDTVANAGDRASSIVNNMLRFSRKSEMDFQKVQVAELIDQTVELAAVDYDLKKKYDFRSIMIERDYQPEIPPLECIPGEIQQVILNLLRNAAHALNERHGCGKLPRITLRTRENDGKIQIEIEDNGSGMDEKTRKRAFEPFFSTKPAGQGTGLGLSVSYYIIHDEHNGHMFVESQPEKGATFIIQLPIKETPYR